MRFFNTLGKVFCCAVILTGSQLLAAEMPPAPGNATVAAPVAVSVPAGEPTELPAMEGMLDKALAAYNSGDYKVFYADYAKTMAAVTTEQAFKTLYVDSYMANFGKYQSRTLVKDQTVIVPDAPVALVVFEAVFEKNPKTKISVNFTREEGAWKVMQIQFAPM